MNEKNIWINFSIDLFKILIFIGRAKKSYKKYKILNVNFSFCLVNIYILYED